MPAMRICITMCHGLRDAGNFPLPAEHFRTLVGIARELKFESIDYWQLAGWRAGRLSLPRRCIMFDFDHPVRSLRHGVHQILAEHGYRGNLFINTGMMHDPPVPDTYTDPRMSWAEIGELVAAGWHIGAHTVTHPNLAELAVADPAGATLARELADCDDEIHARLGIRPRDFAYTGTTWSAVAEKQVAQRYRFGRLWIVGANYHTDAGVRRYADLVNVPGPDEPDGGPPLAARYITKDTHPHRLPSMELQSPLMHDPQRFRAYLQGAEA